MRSFVMICCFMVSIASYPQKPGVKLLAKPKNGSILLRWAPTNSLTWMLANERGYYVERFTITRKNEVQKEPEKTLLTPSPLKPRRLNEWRSEVEKNDYSAIAAQAIYGSSFLVTLPQNGSFTDVANRSEEQEQRFSFALFAADHSFQTAKFSALGLRDSTVRKDEQYLYRVFVANQDSKVKLDTGIFYLGLKDTVGLVPPMNLTAQFADRIVLLKWPKSFVQKVYTSFIIERSEEGHDFEKRNSSPYINASFDGDADFFFQVLDSLPKNGVEYQYRIRGVTPFGEIGPESERANGKGLETLNAKASITDAREENGRVQIQWQILGDSKIVAGYFVERANDASKAFQRLHEKPLSRFATTYIDGTPQSSGYYRIRVIGAGDQSSISFPVLVQLVDSLPPAPPHGLKVKVDTTGSVRLTWNSNSESDLLGYKVYRSNFLSSEFSEINHSAISACSYIDSINIKSLNKKVFYKLAAFDKRMNRSKYSAVVEAWLPDIIPPQPPVIKEIRSDPMGIFIAWDRSASDDVFSYQMERRSKDSLQWKTIKTFNPKDSNLFHDRTTKTGEDYQYRLIAIDVNKLRSKLSNTVWGRTGMNNRRLPITNIRAQIDRENRRITLTWNYDEVGVVKYLVYRAKGSEPLSLYKTESSDAQSFNDAHLTTSTEYKYQIKVVFANGAESIFSEPIKINY